MKLFASLTLVFFTFLPASSKAQVLTTLYTINSNAFDIVTFDLEVVNPSGITITKFDVNANTLGPNSSVLDGLSNGSPQVLSVYLRNGSYVGMNNVANWIFSQNVNFTASEEGTPSSVPLNSGITLLPGNYAFALGMIDQVVSTGAGLSFNNGTGTGATPGSGNQTFSNTDIILRAGASIGNFSGVAGSGTEIFGNFASSVNGARIFNGSIYYSTAVPEPSALAIAGLGLLVLTSFKSARRK